MTSHWNAQQVSELISRAGEVRAPLSVDAAGLLLSRAHHRHYKKGSLITYRAHGEPRFCFLLSGQVRLTSFSPEGQESLSIFVQPGSFWGVHPCLGDYPETNDALAESDCELLMLTPDALQELMQDSQEWQTVMIHFLCLRLNLAIQVIGQYSSWSARERLAWRLLSMVNQYDMNRPVPNQAEISISQESLAAMISLSRQRTNKILKQLEAEQLIAVKYGCIVIKDLAGLKQQFPQNAPRH